MSSAYSAYLRVLMFLPAVLISVCASSSLTFHMIYSEYKLNKQVAIYSLVILLSKIIYSICCLTVLKSSASLPFTFSTLISFPKQLRPCCSLFQPTILLLLLSNFLCLILICCPTKENPCSKEIHSELQKFICSINKFKN